MSVAVVFDTNVVVAAELSPSSESANVQAMRLWIEGTIDFLYTEDTIHEYAIKLAHLGVNSFRIARHLATIRRNGRRVAVNFFHFRIYPTDPDDIAFVLCAANGEATHLLTYDHHISDLAWAYDFSICTPAEFLTWFAAHDPEA